MTHSEAIDWLYRHRRLDPETLCWEYIGDRTEDGKYGRASQKSSIAEWSGESLVHRISAKVFLGFEGGRSRRQQFTWKCGNTLCFNYDHLTRRQARFGYCLCGRCEEEKPLSSHYFYGPYEAKRNPRSESAATRAGYDPWCKQCRRQYYRDNREHWKDLVARWRAENPERVVNSQRQREIRVRQGRTGHVSLKRILIRDGQCCHLCGQLIESLADLHFDHIIPLSKGGEHSENNIAASHAWCNMQKGVRLVPSVTAQLLLPVTT